MVQPPETVRTITPCALEGPEKETERHTAIECFSRTLRGATFAKVELCGLSGGFTTRLISPEPPAHEGRAYSLNKPISVFKFSFARTSHRSRTHGVR